MNVAQETLGLRRQGFSPCLSLLMSAFALLIPPADLSIRLRRPTERSPTAYALLFVRSFRIPDVLHTIVETKLASRSCRHLDFHIYYALLAALPVASGMRGTFKKERTRPQLRCAV